MFPIFSSIVFLRLALSTALFIASILLFRKIFSSIYEKIVFLLAAFVFCFFDFFYIISIFLTKGESGSFIYDIIIEHYYGYKFLVDVAELSFFNLCLIFAVNIAFSFLLVLLVFKSKSEKKSILQKIGAFSLFIIALFFHPGLPNSFIFLALSLLLFVFGIYFYRKAYSSFYEKLFFSLLVFILYLFNIFYAVSNYLTEDGINSAVIYHIKLGLIGAGISDFWKLIALSLFGIILAFILTFWIFTKKSTNKNKIIISYSYAFVIISIIFHPGMLNLVDLYFPSFLAVGAANNDFNYFYQRPKSDSGGNGKKLIVIYAESLEKNYFNESLFPGLVTNLKELSLDGVNFSNIEPIGGASWTMGGIVASQCGLPLFTPTGLNNSPGEFDKFISGATCMSDFLHRKDYYLEYLGGADLEFAKKGSFLKSHSFDEVYGKTELLPNLEDKEYMNIWGLHDDTLFDIAYKKFMDLSLKNKKLALFLLTLGTHNPDGYISESCSGIKYGDGSNSMLNAVKCSDLLISEFIRKIQQSPYGKDTVIAVLSDHLSIKNDATYILNRKDRKNTFFILDPDTSGGNTVDIVGSQLDSGATILPYLGFYTGIGLGRNLQDPEIKEENLEMIRKNIGLWVSDIGFLWDFPQVKENLKINPQNSSFSIDEKEFSLPVKIEFDDKLKTNFKYLQYQQDYGDILSTKKEVPYFIIDNFGEKDFYLIVGKGNNIYKKEKIENEITFSPEEIKKLFPDGL